MNTFEWREFSLKQLKIFTWWTANSPYKDYDGIIADGVVRSGKTIVMAPAFVNWAMERFNGQNFAICGKTIGSLRRNVLNNLQRLNIPDIYLTLFVFHSDIFGIDFKDLQPLNKYDISMTL